MTHTIDKETMRRMRLRLATEIYFSNPLNRSKHSMIMTKYYRNKKKRHVTFYIEDADKWFPIVSEHIIETLGKHPIQPNEDTTTRQWTSVFKAALKLRNALNRLQ